VRVLLLPCQQCKRPRRAEIQQTIPLPFVLVQRWRAASAEEREAIFLEAQAVVGAAPGNRFTPPNRRY